MFLSFFVVCSWTILPRVSVQMEPAAAAKLLQSCPTLCDPIDGSPPGSPIPGILQARTKLEWVAISFSNSFRPKHKYFQNLSHWRASLVAQLIQETWVWSLGWEDPLEKAKATHSSIMAYTVHGVAKSWTQLSHFQPLAKNPLLGLMFFYTDSHYQHCPQNLTIL